MELYLFGLLSVGSIWYFFRLARSAQGGERVDFASFQMADAIFASLLAFYFIKVIADSFGPVQPITINSALLVLNAAFSFVLLGGLLVFLGLRKLNPLTVFGLRHLTGRGMLLALLALVVAFPAVYFTYAVSLHFFGPETKPQPLLQFFLSPTTSLLDRALIVLTAVVVAPLSEEFVFRGYFYGVLRRYGGRWPAIILSAVLFGAIHVHPPAFFALTVLAVALTLVYEYTGSLWAPILMHACFNTATLVFSCLWPPIAN